MYFFCEDVKVYNYEYYCHCTHNPLPKARLKRKARAPRIDIVSSNNHDQQTKQSMMQSKEELTLLQKLRCKQKQIGKFAQNKSAVKDKRKATTTDQTAPYRGDTSVYHNHDTNQSQGGTHSHNFSFCLSKQVLVSHTFNEQDTDGDHFVVQQESSLVDPSLSGKFTQIYCLASNQNYDQNLALDTQVGFLVTLKVFHSEKTQSNIFRELQIYNKIGWHENIVNLYQICFDSGRPIFIKEPYSNQKPTLESKQLIQRDIGNALEYLQKLKIYMGCLQLSDIKNCFGIWKIASFENSCPKSQISIKNNLSQLLGQLRQ